MRGSGLIFLGAASHISCTHALYSRQTLLVVNNESHPLKVNLHSDARSTLLQLSGGGEANQLQPGAANCSGDAPPAIQWWRFRKRRAARKENETTAPEVVEVVLQTRRSVLALDVLRRIRRWLAALVDIATLKRLRQNRQARQVQTKGQSAVLVL